MTTFKLATKNDLHIARKLWHVGTGSLGIFALFYYELSAFDLGKFLVSLGLVGLILDLLRLQIPVINRQLVKVYLPFMRESELTSFTGFPFYAFGTGLSLLLFPIEMALLSCMYLIYCDPLSGLCGNLFGKTKIVGNKTLEGFLGNFFCAFIITYTYSRFLSLSLVDSLTLSFVGASLSSTTELLSGRIDDNFAVPVFSALGLYLFNQVFSFL